jgi:hypothetical protein
MIVAAAVGGNGDLQEAVGAMLRAQATPECGPPQLAELSGCVMGWLQTSDRHAPFACVRTGVSGNLLLVSGTPIAMQGDLDAVLAQAADLGTDAAAAVLTNLDGAFAILHWDAGQRVLTIVTDFLGAQPLHLARAPGVFHCCTGLRGLTGSGLVAARPDPGAWGSFFVFGHPLGNRTLVDGIERAPGAAVLTIRAPEAREQRREYWQWPDAPRGEGDPPTAPFAEALRRSVRGYRAYGHAGAVLMSGGFDSRAVLHMLLQEGLRPRALLVRHTDEAGDADARLGRRAAEAVGVEVQVVAPPSDFYRSPEYRKYLDRSELSNPPLEVFIPRVIAALRPELACVWDGLCVQALRCLPGAPTSFQAYLEQPSLRARTLLATPSPFRLEWAQAMYEGFARLLREETAKHPQDERGVTQFSLRNRTRLRIAANPYRVFAVDALPFTPGLTREYYTLAAGLSNQQKGTHRLIERLYRDYFPEGLRVPFISGGRLVNLSGRRSWDFTYASVIQAVTENYYAVEMLRRTGVVQRPVHSSLERMRALLPDGALEDECIDERALRSAIPANAMRRLYYWKVGRALFQPAAAQPGATLRTSARNSSAS